MPIPVFHSNISHAVETFDETKTQGKDFNSRYRIDPQSGTTTKIGWLSHKIEWLSQLFGGRADASRITTARNIFDDVRNSESSFKENSDYKATPLECKALIREVELARTLLKGKFDPQQSTELHNLTLDLDAQLARLQKMAERSETEERSDTPLIEASRDGNLGTIETLVKAGENLEAKNVAGQTPLIEACESGDVAVIKTLIDAGANVDAVNDDGETALVEACRSENFDIIEILIQADANVEAKNAKGDTPLIEACRYGRAGSPEVVRHLLAAGADKDAVDNTGKTALQIAQELGHKNVVDALQG